MHHITKIKVRNYRGIARLDAKVGPAGLIAEGANATGKTSLLKAIRAALAAQDIKEDAIRIGEDKCEILVDLDDISVRRVITGKGSTLEVKNAAGDKIGSPKQRLSELLGTSPLDPLDLFLAGPKERREMVLAALPIKLTREHVAKWLPSGASVLMQPLPEVFEMHGLEACERLHRAYYEMRAEANRTVKDKSAALKVTEDECDTMAADLPKVPKGTTVDAAQKFADAARTALVTLEAQKKRASEHGAKTQSARERIAGWRKQAAETRSVVSIVGAEERESNEALVNVLTTQVREMREALATAEAELAEARRTKEKIESDGHVATARLKSATDLEKMADDLDQSLADAGEGAPTDFDLDEAQEALTAATATLEAVRQHSTIAARRAALDDDRKELAAAEDRAAELTKLVDRLRVDAPAQLIAESKGIPGLGIDGETITLDGKRIDALSGAEQMRFAVEIARRANERSKFIIVDGLERLDAKAREAFIRHATRDEYQLIASCVGDGEMELVHIEESSAEAAE